MIERFDAFVNGITQIYKSLFRIKNTEMSELNLKGVHVMCLFKLRHASEEMTLTKLSEACNEDKAAMSRIISELTENGYVEANDGKKYRAAIHLTHKGIQASDKLDTMIEAAVNAGGAGLTEEERDTFYRVLFHISDNLKNYLS